MPFGLRRKETKISQQGQPATRDIQTLSVMGRRYFSDAEATYMLPKDMADVPRLDFQHYLLRQAMHGIYIAPIPGSANSILDVGSGTGRWGIEMASAFPRAQIIGMDLEEINSPGAEKPANYIFKQADALKIFPFADNSFDFVHMRLMLLSIPSVKWPDVLSEMLRVVRCGAWIELVEVGCTIWPQGTTTQRWYRWIRQICQSYGQDADIPVRLAAMAHDAGMQNVHEFPYDIPIGRWAGHLGVTSLANMRGFYDAMRARNVRQLQIEPEEIEQTWLALINEWEQLHASIRYYVVCGQK